MMNKILKIFHYLGMILFLGSILTYTVISTLTKNNTLENLVFAREVIYSGIMFLTLPGLILIVLSGLILAIRNFKLSFMPLWLKIKIMLMVIILFNTFVLILPAATDALHLAKESLTGGKLLPEYQGAYMRESAVGAINVLLTLISILLGVIRPSKSVKD